MTTLKKLNQTTQELRAQGADGLAAAIERAAGLRTWVFVNTENPAQRLRIPAIDGHTARKEFEARVSRLLPNQFTGRLQRETIGGAFDLLVECPCGNATSYAFCSAACYRAYGEAA
jgi:hypothetical protein